MSDLAPLESLCSGLLEQLTDKSRRSLSKRIAERLQASQAERIKAQEAPDGTHYVPRKPQKNLAAKKGRIRRRAEMFLKLSGKRWLKKRSDAVVSEVYFDARVQHMAKVHNEGGRDRVNRSGLEVDYPERRLLGFSDGDIDMVKDISINHLANK